jgi:hypothetical protein
MEAKNTREHSDIKSRQPMVLVLEHSKKICG